MVAKLRTTDWEVIVNFERAQVAVLDYASGDQGALAQPNDIEIALPKYRMILYQFTVHFALSLHISKDWHLKRKYASDLQTLGVQHFVLVLG